MNENSLGRLVRFAILALTNFFANAGALGESHTQKHIDCPQGFYADGRLCIPIKDRDHPAQPRSGQCPNGYRAIGKVCVAPSKLGERSRTNGTPNAETTGALPGGAQVQVR